MSKSLAVSQSLGFTIRYPSNIMVKWFRLRAVCLSNNERSSIINKTNNLIGDHTTIITESNRELTFVSIVPMHSVDINFYPHRLHAMSCKSSLRWSLTDMVAHESASPPIDFGRNTSAKFLNSFFSLFLWARQGRVQTSATTGSENSLFFRSSLFISFHAYRNIL